MLDLAALAVAVPLLVLALVVALREHTTSVEATVAVLAAAFAVLIGVVGGGPATDEVADVGPTLVLYCILLVLGHLANAEGIFDWATGLLTRRTGRSAMVTLGQVVLLAAVTTSILSVNATVLLLTPAVVTTVIRTRHSARPHSYACRHLANSASLLTPVGNLTNLLAFTATGLSFLQFTALMALPWLAAVLVEYAVLRRVTAAELPDSTGDEAGRALASPPPPPPPRLALVILALTVVGFAVGSLLGVAPLWPAAGAVAVLAARRLIARTSTVGALIDSANLPFALFVLGLAVLVRGIHDNGVGDLVSAILPSGTGLGALLAVAAIAAVLANLVNNLPATLVLVPSAALIGTPAILAVLIGVNVGANLSYLGSATNLVWRRTLAPYDEPPSAWGFTRLGVRTVPLTLTAATTALWISLHMLR